VVRRIGLLTVLAVALATGAAAQPKLPSIFEFPVDLSSQPDLAKAEAIDVRVRLRDAAEPTRLLHEEVFEGLRPEGSEPLRVKLGLRRPLSRETFLNRSVVCETAARIAGRGEFTILRESAPHYLIFEKPKTLAEKIRLDRWVILGVAGQILFMMRFLLQWIVTERRRESTIPIAFWWCSLVGGLIVLLYGLVEREPIIILGQSCGFVVYTRNLFFIYKKKRQGVEEQPPLEPID